MFAGEEFKAEVMNNKRRQALMTGAMCISIVYLLYRGLFTLNCETTFSTVLSVLLYLAEVYGNMLMFLYFLQIWDPALPDPVVPLTDVTVDVYIPTYNEELELLRGTIVSALELDYPHETYVLDDGARDELQELCSELGANYIRRETNQHAKAGNLNHALERTTGEYVVIFDADHIAERNFITRTLGYFADAKLAFVQTPHSYYNFDSFQGTLNYQKKIYWEEGQLYYNIVQPGKNRWNVSSFCGSAAIFRKSALESVGLIATETITEDMQTGLRLHANGWKSLYVNERLVSGLAPPDIRTFLTQRLRWGEGNLGAFFYDNPITIKGLTLAQRLNYLAIMLSWTTGVQKLALYVAPILMLLTGVGPVSNLSFTLIAITLTYLLSVWTTVKLTGNGYTRLLDAEISQMATFWVQCRATWRAVFGRKKATFVVTKKSGSKTAGIHRVLAPQYLYIAASAAAVAWAVARYMLGISEDLQGVGICTTLVGVNSVFAWIVIRRALAQRRFTWRHPVAAHVKYRLQSSNGIQEGEGFTKDLSEVGCGFICYEKLDGYEMSVTITAGDTSVSLDAIAKNWSKMADVSLQRNGDVISYRYGLSFVSPTKDQLRDLWHICTKYAVARRYREFDPNSNSGLLNDVCETADKPILLPIRVTLPDETQSVGVVEGATNSEFVLLSSSRLTDEPLEIALATPMGDITGSGHVVRSTDIELGTMPLTAYRLGIKQFHGESRGTLTTLLGLTGEKELREITTLQPSQTQMPFLYPAAAAGAVVAIAASIALAVTAFACQDEVLVARTLAKGSVDQSQAGQLVRLADEYATDPTSNETRFLRLRDALQRVGADGQVARLNQVLVDSNFVTPNGRLQQAYALEKLGRPQDAKAAFTNLLENINRFGDRRTRAYLVLGAARNHANLQEYAESVELFEDVWSNGLIALEVRSEFAGVLITAKKYDRAIEVLNSAEMTLEDRFLAATAHTQLNQKDSAVDMYQSVLHEEPNNLRALRGLAGLEAWDHDYPEAIRRYREILTGKPGDLETQIALTKSLSWDGQARCAVDYGVELLATVEDETVEVRLWAPLLKAVSELAELRKSDRAFVTRVFNHRTKHDNTNEFSERLGAAIEHAFDKRQAAPMLAELAKSNSQSRALQLSLATVLDDLGEHDKASAYYESLTAPDNTPKDLVERGVAYEAAARNSQRRGQLRKASEFYQLAMQSFLTLVREDADDVAQWPRLLRCIAGANVHSEDIRSQVMRIFNTRSLIAKDRSTQIALVDALAKIGNDEAGLEVLDELASVTDDQDTQWRRANALMRLERFAEAETLYADMIELNLLADDQIEQANLFLAAGSNAQRLGETEVASERYKQALDRVRATLTSTPGNLDCWRQFLAGCAGRSLVSAADLPVVMQIFKNRSLLARDANFLKSLGDVLMLARNYGDAVTVLTELREVSDKPVTQFKLAQAFHGSQNWRAADQVYRSLLAMHASGKLEGVRTGELLWGAGLAADSNGHRDRAKRLYRDALELVRPGLEKSETPILQWHIFLSSLHGFGEVSARDAQLVQDYYRVHGGEIEDTAVITELAHVLAIMDQSRSAMRLLEQSSQRFRDDIGLRLVCARMLSTAGQFEAAAPHYEWLTSKVRTADKPDSPLVLLEAAENSRKIARHEEARTRSVDALRMLSPRVAANPKDTALWQPFLDAAAGVPSLDADDRAILATLFRGRKELSGNVEFTERLTDVLIKNEDHRNAIVVLKEQQDLSDEQRFRLAVLLEAEGDDKRAEAESDYLIETNAFVKKSDMATGIRLLGGSIALRSNKESKAKRYYSAALDIVRPQLAENPSEPVLIGRFLDAAAGADKLTSPDLAVIDRLRSNWRAFPNRELRERLVDVLIRLDQSNHALPIVEGLVARYPASVENKLRLASTLNGMKQFTKAKIHFSDLLRSDEDTLRVRILVAAARNDLALEDYDNVIRLLDQLAVLGVDETTYDTEYALALQNTGRSDEALARLLGRNDLSVDAQHLLASIQASVGDFETARGTLYQVLEAEPDDTTALCALANIAFELKEHPAAIALYRKVLRLDPNDAKAQELLAFSLIAADNHNEALPLLGSLTAGVKVNPRLQLQYADSLAEVSRYTDAATAYERCLATDDESIPGDERLAVRLRYAGALLAANRDSDALFQYTMLGNEKNLSADSATKVMLGTARCLARLDRFAESLAQFERVRAIDPDTFEFYEEYAGVQLSAGQTDAARESLGRVDRLSEAGMYLQADILVREKRFLEAADVYRAVLAANADATAAKRGLADTSMWGTDYKTALTIYRELVTEERSDSAAVHSAYANALSWSAALTERRKETGLRSDDAVLPVQLYTDALDYARPLIGQPNASLAQWRVFLSAIRGTGQVQARDIRAVENYYKSHGEQIDNVPAIRELARVLIMSGRSRFATELLEQACLRFNDNEELRLVSARMLVDTGDFEAAASHFDWLCERQSEAADRYLLLLEAAENSRRIARHLQAKQRCGEALEQLSPIMVQDPNTVGMWQPFLDAAAGVDRLDEPDLGTLTHLFRERRVQARSGAFIARLTDVLIRTEQYHDAIAVLAEQKELSDEQRFQLAVVLHRTGDEKRADAECEHLIKKDAFADNSDMAIAVRLLGGGVALNMKQKVRARRRYAAALVLVRPELAENPTEPVLIGRFLDAAAGAETLNAADLAFIEHLRLNWQSYSDRVLRERLVDVLVMIRQPGNALPIVKGLIAEYPESIDNRLRLADTLHAMRRYLDAQEHYARLLGSETKLRRRILGGAARNRLALKDFAGTVRHLEELFATGADPAEFDSEYALALFKLGRTTEALSRLNSRNDLTVDSLHLLAAIQSQTGDYIAARTTFRDILAIEPADKRAALGLADIAFELKDYDQAITSYRSVLQSHPNDTRAQEMLAFAFTAVQKHTEALPLLKSLSTNAQASVRARLQYADTLAELDRHSEAATIYEQCLLSRDGSFTENERRAARVRYANALLTADRHADALAEYARLNNDRDLGTASIQEVMLGTARSLARLDRFVESLVQFERVRAIAPDAFEFYEEYAGVQLSAGQFQAARESLELAGTLSSDGKYLKADILVREKKFAQAAQVYHEIISVVPNATKAKRGLADTSTWAADYPTALATYKELLAKHPDDDSLQLAYAQALLWSGDKSRALPLLVRILNRDSSRSDLWGPLLLAASQKAPIDREAKLLISQIMDSPELWPSEPGFRQHAAMALVNLGRIEDGLQILRSLLAAHPNSAAIRRQLADALHQLRRFEEAETHYVRLLQMVRTRQSSSRTANASQTPAGVR